MHAKIEKIPAQAMTLRRPLASMPTGLSASTGAPSSLPGESAKAVRAHTAAPTASQATGRQRRDGGFPSGKRRTRKTAIGTMNVTQLKVLYKAVNVPPGSEPGLVRSA